MLVEVVQSEEPTASEQLDELCEEFLKVFREVRKGGEGNLMGKKKPTLLTVETKPK